VRDSHGVAISNDRIHDIDHDQVRLTYKEYRTDSGHAVKPMTLTATEFMRRFFLHALQLGFHRIRYYTASSPPEGETRAVPPTPRHVDV